MSDDARLQANRANARLSTGPSTTDGKARASQNARRHGLSVSAAADPHFEPQIAAMAAALAGEGADAARLEGAARLAAAQIDLDRVRRTREHILQQPIHAPRPDLRAWSRAVAKADPYNFLQIVRAERDRPPPPPRTPGLAEAIDLRGAQLRKLDRYERRALSRRKAAIRELDALPPPRVPPPHHRDER